MVEREARNRVLEGQVARLAAPVESLLKRLAERNRSAQRQAAPFFTGPPQPAPHPTGRKSGEDDGRRHRRAVPPQPTDKVYEALHQGRPPGVSLTPEAVPPKW